MSLLCKQPILRLTPNPKVALHHRDNRPDDPRFPRAFAILITSCSPLATGYSDQMIRQMALPHLPSSLGSIPYSPLNRVSSTPGIRQPVQVSPGVDDCHQQRVSPEIELAAAHQRGLRPTWVAGHYGADVISYFLQQQWPSNSHDLSRPMFSFRF